MNRLIVAAVLLSVSFAHADWEESDARPGLLRTGGFMIFMNSRAPLSYETLSANQLPQDAADVGPVTCKSCQHGVSIPISPPSGTSRGNSISGSGGNGGFEKALANLKKARPEIRGIYDVKVDYHRVSILGIYRRQCVEVAARGFK